ncbi:hypothetical protein Peur_061699 [Populus x canadensis]
MTLFLLEFLVLGRRHCRYICHRKDIKWQIVNDDKESEAKSLGFSEEVRSNYSEMDYVREELKFAPMIVAPNPVWSASGNFDRKAIEETSAVILRIYHDRQHKCSTPRITKRC